MVTYRSLTKTGAAGSSDANVLKTWGTGKDETYKTAHLDIASADTDEEIRAVSSGKSYVYWVHINNDSGAARSYTLKHGSTIIATAYIDGGAGGVSNLRLGPYLAAASVSIKGRVASTANGMMDVSGWEF